MTSTDIDESWPSGRQLRTLTRAATEAHTGGHMGELVSEVYSVLFSGTIAVVMVLGAVQGLNASIHPGPEQATVDPSWLALVVALVVAGAVLGVAVLGLVATAFALFAAFLNAAFDFCLGCEVYLLVRRVTPRTKRA